MIDENVNLLDFVKTVQYVSCKTIPTKDSQVWEIIEYELDTNNLMWLLIQTMEYPKPLPYGMWLGIDIALPLYKANLVTIHSYPPYTSQGKIENHNQYNISPWCAFTPFGIKIAKLCYQNTKIKIDKGEKINFTPETYEDILAAEEFFKTLEFRNLEYPRFGQYDNDSKNESKTE